MPIALRLLPLADVLVLARVPDPLFPSDDESRRRSPANPGEEKARGEHLPPDRLSDLRRRVVAGHYDLPETIAALARRLLDVLR